MKNILLNLQYATKYRMNGRTIITFSYIVAFACLMLYKQPCFAAEQQQTDEGWILSTDLVGAYNPEALAVLADASYVDVYHTDNSPLWNGLYIKGGSQLSISPAHNNGSTPSNCKVSWIMA